MGFDTSHHPVDLELVARITDYIAGRGAIDDLVADAVRHAKIRFRANAWGLAVTNLEKKPPGFDTSLHIWGRPFFVTVEGTDAIAEMLDRYLAAKTNAQADALAKENIAALDSKLPKHITPRAEGSLPKDADLATGVRRNIDLMRESCAASKRKGGMVKLPDGEETDAAKLLARELPLQVLSFCAANRPGWMDRGYVWPTNLFRQAKVATGKLFAPPRALLGSLARAKVAWFLKPTIVENYMVGGLVGRRDVPRLCATLAKNRARLEACYDGGEDMKTSVKKLVEAADDAKLRGFAFAEATEVYSGFSGIMN
jgi:hypothetical protein